MSLQLDPCFGNIFGLTRTECNCDDVPLDASVSDSGIFLDELIPINWQSAAADCRNGSIWDMMEKARSNAISDFKNDLLSCIKSKSNLLRKPFSGSAGEWHKANNYIQLKKNYHGLRISLARIAGGYGFIKKIGTYFNINCSLECFVYNSYETDPVTSFVLDVEGGKFQWHDVNPIPLNLYDDVHRSIEYYVVYQPIVGLSAKNTQMSCQCGGSYRPHWNVNSPSYYSVQPKGDYGWANYAMIAGTNGSSLDDKGNWQTFNETQGLALMVDFGCKTESTICNESINYDSNPYALAMAYAIRFRAAWWLCDFILKSPNINRYTLMAGDIIAGEQKNFQKEYEDRVYRYLCEEISNPENINMYSDCYTCIDNGFMKVGIFV